jgi:hypothetical protein
MAEINKKAVSKLFDQGFGARQIASKLGYEHHASVSRCLKKLGKTRPKRCVAENSRLSLILKRDETQLRIAAEHFAKFFFILNGFNVLVPEVGAPYDLMVDMEDGLQKVQVKSSTCKVVNGYIFALRRTRNNSNSIRRTFYSSKDCDWFFLLDLDMNAWLIPFHLLKGKGAITPQNRFPGYKVNVGVVESADTPVLKTGA